MRPPLHSGANLDTKSRDKSLSYRLTLALNSDPKELPQGLQFGPAIPLALTLTRVCVFKLLSPETWATDPPGWALPSHRQECSCPLKETVPFTVAQILQIMRSLHSPRGHPNFLGHPEEKCTV